MQKHNILFIPSMVRASDFGGITHQKQLIRHLQSTFHVHLVKLKDSEERGIVLPELEDHEVTAARRVGYAKHAYSAGKELARNNSVKLVYARHGLATIPALKIGRKLDIPTVLEVNGILSDEDKSTWLLRKIDRDCAKDATAIIAVTQGIKEHLVDNHNADPSNVHVIPNGADTEHFRPMDQQECREKLGLGKGPVITYIGNLESWQGVETIISSAPMVLKKWPDARFIIGGYGSLKSQLEAAGQKMKDNVMFLGPVDYDEVPIHMNASDVCLVPKLPLKSGYSPLKLYEYMACGRPVIASNLPGFELVKQNNAGLLVPPGDHEGLAAAINQLLSEPEKANEMGLNGRKVVEQKHSWKHVAERVARICLDTIDGGKK